MEWTLGLKATTALDDDDDDDLPLPLLGLNATTALDEEEDDGDFFVLHTGNAFKWSLRLAKSTKLHEQPRQIKVDDIVTIQKLKLINSINSIHFNNQITK